MYNAMRRCVPIASLLLGPVIYPQRTTPNIIGAIILITTGTITAAIGDLDFDFKVDNINSIDSAMLSQHPLGQHITNDS